MAILFCGIVMSHYTHFNLSPMTQITVQSIFRTTAFMAGMFVCLFLFLLLAVNSRFLFCSLVVINNCKWIVPRLAYPGA